MQDIILNLTNCVSDVTQYDPSKAQYYSIKLTANDGYIFEDDDIPTLTICRHYQENTYNFTISDDKDNHTIK